MHIKITIFHDGKNYTVHCLNNLAKGEQLSKLEES